MNNKLQKVNVKISDMPEVHEVLFKQIKDIWENVDVYEKKALNISVIQEYKSVTKKKKTREPRK